ncbi:hypothetical protein O181_024900 [Austropuccinia psidii MF-1]|uniref:Uncharacterized protein n=1 Tax=Austropuccinia psidii MF-1 TaxID=1389203 RepID=A0A9Q3H0K4_9BASI|nr:hypothetical protein [Austropuccinia psidii MF-1]
MTDPLSLVIKYETMLHRLLTDSRSSLIQHTHTNAQDLDSVEILPKAKRNLFYFYAKSLGELELNCSDVSVKRFLKKIWLEYITGIAVIKNRTNESVINRIAHIMKSSFLKIQVFSFLTKKARRRGGRKNDFDLTAFHLVEHICHFALFGQVEQNSEHLGLEQGFNKADMLNKIRRTLEDDGDDQSKGEKASWYVTGFCVGWFWKEKLTTQKKNAIEHEIKLRAQRIHLKPSDEDSFVKRLDSTAKKETRIFRQFIPSYSQQLADLAFAKHEFDLAQFLNTIRQKWQENHLPIFHDKSHELILKRIAYAMKGSFVKIQAFANFQMGGLPKAEFVDNFEAQALNLLQYFWRLALFGRSDDWPSPNSEREKSMDLDELLDDARESLNTSERAEKRLEPASWYATMFCVEWLWYENNWNHWEKADINNAILRLARQNNLDCAAE